VKGGGKDLPAVFERQRVALKTAGGGKNSSRWWLSSVGSLSEIEEAKESEAISSLKARKQKKMRALGASPQGCWEKASEKLEKIYRGSPDITEAKPTKPRERGANVMRLESKRKNGPRPYSFPTPWGRDKEVWELILGSRYAIVAPPRNGPSSTRQVS